jgi:hypothetical protein
MIHANNNVENFVCVIRVLTSIIYNIKKLKFIARVEKVLSFSVEVFYDIIINWKLELYITVDCQWYIYYPCF